MKNQIQETVNKFYNELTKHKNHRYLSWEHCYNTFQKHKLPIDKDYSSLQLAFYLASWGMIRGSTGLLWKDYKVHFEAIDIINNVKYDNIRCSSDNEINENQIELILEAKKEISEYYMKVDYIKPTINGDKECKIKPTDTLITKILLGTLGCVPAYDRLLKIGLKEEKIGQTFNKKSLHNLFDFVNKNISDLKTVQTEINQKGCYYPIMKIVDMYFWEIGRIKLPFESE